MRNQECSIDWDFKIGDKIEYFDATKSYELTGYRPINDTQGLDFDPALFRQPALNKIATGQYCNSPKNSIGSYKFWKEEMLRIEEGITINGYTLTGHNYFYINYYSLGTGIIVDNEKTGKSEAVAGTAAFYESQYQFFHYLELCERTKKDACFLKARGVGASEIAASIAANTFTHKAKSNIIYTASSEGFLKPLWEKFAAELSFLNIETQGGFKRLRQGLDKLFEVRASVIRDKNEQGHFAQVKAIIVDVPSKIRGPRTKYVFFEESGSYKNLTKAWQVAEPLTLIQGQKIGTRISFGTGGDSGPDLAGLDEMFYDPITFNILPFKHTFNAKKEVQYTSFFMASYCNNAYVMDDRGFVNRAAGEEWEQLNMRNTGKAKVLTDKMAEYCWYPSEALSKKGDNRFNQQLLQEQLINIKDLKQGKPLIEGDLQYVYTDSKITGVRWVTRPGGPIIRTDETPITLDQQGNPFKSYAPLYIAGIDSIDKGYEDSVVGKRGSEFCITVKKRAYGMGGDEYVCIYKERPAIASDAYDIALKILMFYGCAANLEDTKDSIIGHFRKMKQGNRLIARPRIARSDKYTYKQNSLIGTPGSARMIKLGLNLIEDYVEESSTNLHFIDMITQLQDYSYELKTNFDLVAAMGMTEIYDQELEDFAPTTETASVFKWEKRAWYTDANGNRKYGVVDKRTKIKSEFEGKPSFGFSYN